MKKVKNLIYKTYHLFNKLILTLLISIESICLIPFFLFNRNIWITKVIHPFFHWSFGHTIAGNDVIARLFYPQRISILVIFHPNVNTYLFDCFHKSANVFYYKGLFLTNNRYILNLRLFFLRFLINFFNSLFFNRVIVNDFHNYYSVNPYIFDQVFTGNEELNFKYKINDFSGYVRLLQENIGNKLELQQKTKDTARKIIENSFPNFFDKNFVTILFRRKGEGSDFSTKMRNTNPENYIQGINYLINNNYNVAIIGDYTDLNFVDNKNVFNFVNFKEYKLLNIFLLTNCIFFIGQQSGPYLISNSSGIPCLLIDCFPHRLGSYNKYDICLYKRVIKDKEEVNLEKIIKLYPEILIGYKFKYNNLIIEDNTSLEIFSAIKEMLESMCDNNIYLERSEKYESIRNICPKEILLKYSLSSIPLFKM